MTIDGHTMHVQGHSQDFDDGASRQQVDHVGCMADGDEPGGRSDLRGDEHLRASGVGDAIEIDFARRAGSQDGLVWDCDHNDEWIDMEGHS